MKQKTQNSETVSDPAVVIRRNIRRLNTLSLRMELVKKVLLILLIVVMVLCFYGFAPVHTNGMNPAFYDGDLAIFYRWDNSFLVGDAVVYSTPDGDTAFSRVAAVAGDTVNIDETGHFLVNGQIKLLYDEQILISDPGDQIYPLTVPEDSVYLLNDNVDEGSDSRNYGVISTDQIKGGIIQLFRRRNF